MTFVSIVQNKALNITKNIKETKILATWIMTLMISGTLVVVAAIWQKILGLAVLNVASIIVKTEQ